MRKNKIMIAGLTCAIALGAQGALAQDAAPASQSSEASSSAAPVTTPVATMIDGKGVLVIDDTLMKLSLKQHPSSYTGALTTVTVKMGEKLRDNGTVTLKPRFTGGTETDVVAQAGAYNITLRLDGFSFKYDSLSSMGMAVTPRVTITITADVTGPSGAAILHKAYNRTDLTAGHYIASFKPAEKVQNSLDKALGEIFNDMATDIAAVAETAPASTPAPEAVATPAEPTAVPVSPAAVSDAPASSEAAASSETSSVSAKP
jgi:hypothetical protein